MVVKWLLNLFFCVALGKHFETLFVQLMLVICSERNEGFLLAPAVPWPAGQPGLFSSPSASRCWLPSGENRSLARTVCLLSSLSSGSGVMLIYRVRPVACSSCLPLGESRSNFLTARLWCGWDCRKLASSRRGMRCGSDGISGPAVFEDSLEQIDDRTSFVTSFPSHISVRSEREHDSARSWWVWGTRGELPANVPCNVICIPCERAGPGRGCCGLGLDAPAGPFGAGAARQVEPGRLAVLAAVH